MSLGIYIICLCTIMSTNHMPITRQSYTNENGYSPRPNLTHNRVTRLVWWHTLTRHVKWNKFPSHTWLPYLTPNGVTHYNNTWIVVFFTFIIVEYQPIITSKYHQNHAEKYYGFWTPYPNGRVFMSHINDKHIKPCRTSQTSNTPPSRRTSTHKHRANCSKLRVNAKMAND